MKQLNNKDYHASEGLSASGIKEFLVSPAHFMEYKSRAFDESVKLESLVHLFLLEPDSFDDNFAVVPDRRTKEGKLAYSKALEDGKLVVKEDDVTHAQMIAYNVLANKDYKDLFTKGVNESSIFIQDPNLDITLKIRPDILLEEQGLIIDLKTISRGMSKFSLESVSRTRGWDIQAAFYTYVAEIKYGKKFNFHHLYIEKEMPFGVRQMKMSQESIDNALSAILPSLVEYSECIKNSDWPSYSTTIEELNIRRHMNTEESFL